MNDSFEQRLRENLRQSEQHVDADTRAKLAAARRQALEHADTKSAGWFGWLPPFTGLHAAGTLAAIAVVVAVTVQTMDPIKRQKVEPQLTASAGSETDVDSARLMNETDLYENLELLEFYEELEFYEWLAEEIPEERTS